MASVTEELKQNFIKGTALVKFIYVNVAVFLIYNLAYLVLFFWNQEDTASFYITQWLAIPASLPDLLTKPWTIITYMFYHQDIWHILFNMLFLYWFGNIFLMYFDSKKFTSLYFLGGIMGGIFYLIAFNSLSVFKAGSIISVLLGASASVMAIVFAISLYVPNFRVNMLFFGEVKLIYIALFTVVLDLIMIPKENPGGHIAHLGGALIGFLFVLQYRKGRDITKGFTKVLDFIGSLFKPRKLKVAHKKPVNDMDYRKTRVDTQKEIDRILDKISKGGYESLTKEEKETLFRMGNSN
jgi:membrane associated rhomboid family serine protease